MHREAVDLPEESVEKETTGDAQQEMEREDSATTDVLEELTVDPLQELQSKADEYLDKYRRSAAEFSNYRKRQERERTQQMLRSKISILGQLLPVVDDLERALDHVPEDQAEVGWVQGMVLIEQKMKKLLEGFGVVPIETVGERFDPEFHSGLMKEESDAYPVNTVMEELQRGYLIDGKVLRAAMVKLSLGSGSGEERDETGKCDQS